VLISETRVLFFYSQAPKAFIWPPDSAPYLLLREKSDQICLYSAHCY